MALFTAPLRISAAATLAVLAGCSANTEALFGPGGSSDTGTAANGGGDNNGSAATSSGGSSSGGSSSGGMGGSDAACEPTQHDLAQRDTYMEFVIDTSGSMGTSIPNAGADRLEGALVALADAFSGFPTTVRVGATLFPGLDQTSNDWCYAAEQNVAFIRAIDATGAFVSAYREPNDGTPTHNAVHFGLNQLRGVSPVDGDRYLFVITDGMGNYGIGNPSDIGRQCTGDGDNDGELLDPTPMLDEISAARNDEQIFTFVAGLPGSWNQYASTLSEMARLGGTPNQTCLDDSRYACHLDFDNRDPDFREGLTSLMGDLARVTRSCGFHLPPNADPGLIQIRYNDTKLLQYSENCDVTEGYTYAGGTSVVFLCSDVCEDYLNEAGKITATLLCPDEL